jgi:hypothetical protein
MPWRVVAASATGSSHREDGRPCQDAFAFARVGDGLIATVCDGAGSCATSDLGARWLADAVVRWLSPRVAAGELLPETPVDACRALVERAVAEAREEVCAAARRAAAEPAAFAATLVGVLAWPGGGQVFHVGDGYAVARPAAGEPDRVSLPENGEYVNETYFVTGDEWRRHLRVASVGLPLATVVLMSDGAAGFAITKDRSALFPPFIDPVLRYLASVSEAEGSLALAATLGDARTDGITTDDKTLLIARWA